jgi:hypothetical protein
MHAIFARMSVSHWQARLGARATHAQELCPVLQQLTTPEMQELNFPQLWFLLKDLGLETPAQGTHCLTQHEHDYLNFSENMRIFMFMHSCASVCTRARLFISLCLRLMTNYCLHCRCSSGSPLFRRGILLPNKQLPKGAHHT